jgi:excisionase family DNA binding protein
VGISVFRRLPIEVSLMAEPWLSADQIAAHVTKGTVYPRIAEKGMPAHKIGRLQKFQVSEVDEWVGSENAAAQEEDV